LRRALGCSREERKETAWALQGREDGEDEGHLDTSEEKRGRKVMTYEKEICRIWWQDAQRISFSLLQ
jgi:hypothetical protein